MSRPIKQLEIWSPASSEENHQSQKGISVVPDHQAAVSAIKTSIPSSQKPDVETRAEATEVARLQRELLQAQDQIARQAQQLTQDRLTKRMMAQQPTAMSDGNSSPVAPQRSYAPMPAPGWTQNEDSRSEVSELNAQSSIWSMPPRTNLNMNLQPDTWGMSNNRAFETRTGADMSPMLMTQEQPNQQRNYSVPLPHVGRGINRGMQEPNMFGQGRGFGHPAFGPRGTGYSMLSQPSASGMNFSHMGSAPSYQGFGSNPSYQPQPIGTPLTATASNFNHSQTQQSANPWNAGVSTDSQYSYCN